VKITQLHLRQLIREAIISEMARTPPRLRMASNMEKSCGTCAAFCPRTKTCKAFGGVRVREDLVCDAWNPASA
jgi:hypothetical protein